MGFHWDWDLASRLHLANTATWKIEMFHRLRVVIDKFTTFHRCLFVYWRVKLAVFARNPARKYPKGKFSCSFTSPISHQEWAVNGSIKVMGPMAEWYPPKKWNLCEIANIERSTSQKSQTADRSNRGRHQPITIPFPGMELDPAWSPRQAQ